MDDLISRKTALELLGKPHPLDHNAIADVQKIIALPSVPAVPLDRLCEWMANSFSDPPCCTLENVRCKMECRGFTQMDYSECWRYVVTKWMEGLDGGDANDK